METNTDIKQVTSDALATFVTLAQDVADEYLVSIGVSAKQTLSVEMGRKYARIVKSGSGVYCFVEMSTGNILKAASYIAPAKGVRGNIHSNNARAAITGHGAVYNR
jgi:hypothetical protein